MTEMDKLKNGEEFQNRDEEISAAKLRARALSQKLNAIPVEDQEKLLAAAKELFGSVGDDLCLKTPVQCDFGFNIHIGNSVLINYNCVFLDAAPITIGDNCFIGPMTGMYTVSHPFDPVRRNEGFVSGKPIVLKENVWVGGGVTILSGVTIGKNVIVAAGSVVTKDVPDNVIVAGNPARVIRELKFD
ncbi:MAG: sugar O-acetyltransferase [Lachnospiraceae bacterium]|nr:sugar O-acetyltransferase [Lachnospiraceae bacterium]